MVGTGETPLFAEADWSLQQDFLEPELQHCSVTEVRALAARLRELQTASQAEEASSVLSHYSAFVATAREISSLQADVSRASEALAGLAAVQQQLREPSLAAQPAQSAQLGGSLHLLLRPSEPASTTALHAFSELMELLEVQLGALFASPLLLHPLLTPASKRRDSWRRRCRSSRSRGRREAKRSSCWSTGRPA
jgi:hypothetical protein